MSMTVTSDPWSLSNIQREENKHRSRSLHVFQEIARQDADQKGSQKGNQSRAALLDVGSSQPEGMQAVTRVFVRKS